MQSRQKTIRKMSDGGPHMATVSFHYQAANDKGARIKHGTPTPTSEAPQLSAGVPQPNAPSTDGSHVRSLGNGCKTGPMTSEPLITKGWGSVDLKHCTITAVLLLFFRRPVYNKGVAQIGSLGECLPGARPARYLSINYPDLSARFTLSWTRTPSRPRCTANLPYKAHCIIKEYL